jgi:AraC family transcriptional regulator
MSNNRLYAEALGIVVAHEVTRLSDGKPSIHLHTRGRLASWQERIIVSYLGEHRSEPIPIAPLAQLVRLSPFHFSRALKQSFGVPPHRYRTMQRIEHAEVLRPSRRTPSPTSDRARVSARRARSALRFAG